MIHRLVVVVEVVEGAETVAKQWRENLLSEDRAVQRPVNVCGELLITTW
jgi:hypothetical protein